MSDREQVQALALLREALKALADRTLTPEERESMAAQIDQFLNYGRSTTEGRA